MGLRRFTLASALAAALILVACSDDEPAPASPAQIVDSAWETALADSARLIDVLPDSTLAYIRIPTLWGLLAAPKSGALQAALGSPANRDTILALQTRIPEVMDEDFGELAPLISLLLADLRSPIEIALVGEGPQPLEADLVIEARLAMDSIDELNELLGRYTSPQSPFQQLQAASAEQPGQLLVGLFPMFYHFDADTQRVRMVGGMAASIESFERAQAWSAAESTPLSQREQTVDDSGHGLMVWADGTRLMPALEQMASPEDLAGLRELGLLGLKEFALAYGSQSGKARLSLVARGEAGPLWAHGLPVMGPSSVPISAEADFVAGWVLPDHDWVEKVWRALDPEASDRIREINAALLEATGLELSAFIDAIAGRWMLVDDESGTWMVHEPTVPPAWSTLIEGLIERFEVTQTEVEDRGQTLRHLAIPGFSVPDLLPEAEDPQERIVRFIGERLMAVGSHIHWTEDSEGRRILAAVPQVLRDRRTLSGEQNLSDWLDRTGVSHADAAAFGAIEIADAPRRNYYSYLTLLQALGDVFETPVDLHAFPSAQELGLAREGSIGIEMTWSSDTLGLGLIFENHPGDLMYSGAGGLGGIAMLGIVAAVAVPAYQDYVQRAASSELLAFAAGAQLGITEFYLSEGRLPNAEEAAQFTQVFDTGPVERIDYNARLLRLVMTLSPEAGLGDGATLELVPVLQDGMISRWRCSSPSIDSELLPLSCRP
jgi:hypothetical protein